MLSTRYLSQAVDIITTFAGTGSSGYSGDNGAASSAKLYRPYDIAFDSEGNAYIADTDNHRIRYVDKSTGIITTIAGTGSTTDNGDNLQATSTNLKTTVAVVVDISNNFYITDCGHCKIRKVTVATGLVSTLAGTGTCGTAATSWSGEGGQATATDLFGANDIVLDSANNIYFSEYSAHRVFKVDVSTGIINVVAGNGVISSTGDDGPATSATVQYPSGVTFDSSGIIIISHA